MGHREVLGVSSNADSDEIKRAFHRKAKETHPDISNSPEAAEAFQRIKEAHDALMNEEMPAVKDAETIKKATAAAAQATAAAAFTPPVPPPPPITAEELEHIQNLDQQVAKKPRLSFFRRRKESAELKRHRHRIKTNNRRLDGKY